VESHGEERRQKIKTHLIQDKARRLCPSGRIAGGEQDLRSPQFRAGGVRTPPAAGCGGHRSPALPRPEHRGVGEVAFEDALELWVGQLGIKFSLSGP
jgi:hypothetical protein